MNTTLPGITFGAPGNACTRPTVPTWRPGVLGDDAVHHVDVACRREQAVAAVAHRRRAGVVGEAFGGHFPLADADDALDHADVELLAIEVAALLDVQLDVRGHVARRARFTDGELRRGRRRGT